MVMAAAPQPTLPLLVLAFVCSGFCWLPASGQVPQVTWPFTGQGMWPDSLGVVVVTVDVHLDRILEINQEAGSWRAVHRVHLSWLDPRAEAAVVSATNDWYNASSPYGTCSMPCDASMNYEAGCCTSLWLPQIDLPNLMEYNYQVTPPRWRIWVEPVVLSDGSSSSRVHWTVRLDATWFSPFDFRAWPLEHQHLVMELQPSPVLANKMVLVLGSLSQLSNTPHTKGVDIAGWWVNKVTPRMYNTSACFKRSNTTFLVFNLADANTSSSSTVQHVSISPGSLTTLLSNTTLVTTVLADSCGAIGNAEGISQYGPYVLVVDSMMMRDRTFYILVFIVPLILVTLMVFVIYAMERTNLEARMGVVVTLVLALSALQFMYNFPPASYLNVVQQLTLVSYVLFALIAIECIITSSIATIHERKRKYEATLTAAGLKSVTSAWTPSSWRPSIDLDRSSAGTDVFPGGYNNDSRSSTSSASGLFFGSQPPLPQRRFSDPSSTSAAPAPPSCRNSMDCVVAPLSPIPESPVTYPSSRPWAPANGRLTINVDTQLPEPEQPPQRNSYPNLHTRSTQVVDFPVAATLGQPIAEGMEWNTLPKVFKRTSAPASPGSMERGLPPAKAVGQAKTGSSKFRQSMGQAKKSVVQLFSHVHGKTKALHSKMSMDEAFAHLLARRVDIIASCTLAVAYIIVISTILAVSSNVGDHKLMLAGASAPGNM